MLYTIFLALLFIATPAQANYKLEILASGLDHPWSIAFLPNNEYLVSMRGGELRRFSMNDKQGVTLSGTPATYVQGQAGYFDIALDPDFTTNQTVYLAFASGTKKASSTSIIQAVLRENRLENIVPIFTAYPMKNGPNHFGGRLQFLNDGTLLLTTGDRFEYREDAQDTYSQLGKIVRIERNGDIPTDNPFSDGQHGDPAVWSYGHRNPQGLTYNAKTNTVFMHEHGPRGGDEVNIVKPGLNYGWPAVTHGINYSGAQISPFNTAPGMEDSIKHWVPSIAPSGLAYYDGEAFPDWRNSLFVGALINKEVRRLSLDDHNQVIAEETLFAEIQERIRDVRVGPDGLIYILTDSSQGKLIRVLPLP
ncbi:MAG: PQQ-dependent sugar dehydrogenase [Pseudomonadales bacterium]|nr:PQQ-dependent sugar dehydrogenase [Pseudomonadales bacterium]